MIAFALMILPSLQAPPAEDAWKKSRLSLPGNQQVGFDFLLEHMPEKDRQALSPKWLVEQLQTAYATWETTPWKDQVPQAIFFNEVLPYASVNERRDTWRKDFHQRFAPLILDAKTPSEAAVILNQQIFSLLKVKYSTQRPKADQSPLESMEAGLASCTGLSILLVDACRSVGVPARFVGTPLWADGSGNHSWVEIWDDGWHFTGAAEPTGNQLNQAWFTDRASQAVPEDKERAIYAVSYRATPQHFPMVWAPDADFVHAVNVTHRYVQKPPVAEGFARILFSALDGSGQRIPASIELFGTKGELLAEIKTHDESHDANDHLTLDLPLGVRADVRIRWEKRHFRTVFKVVEDETLVEAVFSQEVAVQVLQPNQRLWRAHQRKLRETRAKEMENRVLQFKDWTLPFWWTAFGEKPVDGYSLWISLHGGGGTTSEVNDGQWENQKKLYELKEGFYLAPRAPTNTWNLWHQSHIDVFLDRLIENMVALYGVNPNKVYVLGYSAGGDGVFQLAPRMADRWAAAGMMAGHPNETKPDGLRNLPFTLHMGGEDGAYDRNQHAVRWKEELAALHKEDSDGYPHWAEIHAGKGHWMDRQDAAALPWMAKYTRNLRPEKVVWLQDDVTHSRFYWLAVEQPVPRSRLVVQRKGQTFQVLAADGLSEFKIRLDASMVDFSQEIVVQQGERILFQGEISPSMGIRRKTLAERGDPDGIWSAEITVVIPKEK
ncbi:MAG: hypothetical protein OTJ44_00600 [Planctomycetota bacterium]|nr:hypothetical protein [Planctomycetota bacterium]